MEQQRAAGWRQYGLSVLQRSPQVQFHMAALSRLQYAVAFWQQPHGKSGRRAAQTGRQWTKIYDVPEIQPVICDRGRWSFRHLNQASWPPKSARQNNRKTWRKLPRFPTVVHRTGNCLMKSASQAVLTTLAVWALRWPPAPHCKVYQLERVKR